jgi:soluble cytochrome b562
MNEAFSKSLSDVLTHTNGKLSAQLNAEVSAAITDSVQAMNKAAKRMEQTAANVTDYEKELKITLDKRIKSYKSSIDRLCQIIGWRELLFLLGTAGGIITPIVLILNHLL